MKSEFYLSFVKHLRYIPKRYSFDYNFFWTKFNLDELDILDSETRFFSRNKFNIISFFDADHLHLGFKTTKENITAFLRQNGVKEEILSVELITNPRILGYTFNPVSFYFIETEISSYMVIEIGNTFKELKPYFVSPDFKNKNEWIFMTPKHFYISPFISATNSMTFKVKRDEKNLIINIDDFNSQGELELRAFLKGKSLPWSSKNIIRLVLKYPFITLRIITAIHYHAFRLFCMRIPFWKKTDQADLQTDVFALKDGKYQKNKVS